MNIRAIAFTEKGQGWQEKLGFPVTRGGGGWLSDCAV